MKRLSALILALLFVFMILPITANASPSYIYVGGVKLDNGKYAQKGCKSRRGQINRLYKRSYGKQYNAKGAKHRAYR